MTDRVFIKIILVEKLDSEIKNLLPEKYTGIEYDADKTKVVVHLNSDPTIQEDTDLTELINNHIPTPSLLTSTIKYLKGDVVGFIQDLIDEEAAINITEGITVMGKSAHVLGLMTKKYDIKSNGFPVSLAETFQFKSLYVSLEILQHIRDNPSEINNLAPFVDDARLLAMKNKIEKFLDVTPLST